MIYHIITNSKIYQSFKEDVLSFNTRLFDDSYFLKLNSYKDPIDLTGMDEFLEYSNIIEIDSIPSFFDYINIILILNYLKSRNYKGIINVNYVNINKQNYKESIIISKRLLNIDNIYLMFESLIQAKELKNLVDIPGANTYINFYNNLIDKDIFISINEEALDEYDSIDSKALYLADKYIDFNLDKSYYYNYLKEYYDKSR